MKRNKSVHSQGFEFENGECNYYVLKKQYEEAYSLVNKVSERASERVKGNSWSRSTCYY